MHISSVTPLPTVDTHSNKQRPHFNPFPTSPHFNPFPTTPFPSLHKAHTSDHLDMLHAIPSYSYICKYPRGFLVLHDIILPLHSRTVKLSIVERNVNYFTIDSCFQTGGFCRFFFVYYSKLVFTIEKLECVSTQVLVETGQSCL